VSKFASADFENFCWLASKKCTENAVFFRLKRNTVMRHLSDKLINYLCAIRKLGMVMCAVKLNNVSQPKCILLYLHIGADSASKVRGVISVIFGSQVSLRVHYCKRHKVY